jgi:hypothetical protein
MSESVGGGEEFVAITAGVIDGVPEIIQLPHP